jgi:Tol biopolymer transport system component
LAGLVFVCFAADVLGEVAENPEGRRQEPKSDSPILTGPYLGQKPPGKTPVYFAPGIITVDANFEHSAAVFSPDGSEVFWCTNVDFYTDKRVVGNLRLYTMRIANGKWTVPHPAPFTGGIRVERPVFSPDGSRLYIEYGSDPTDIDSDSDIYVVERNDEGWSEPSPVSPLINSPAYERLHCVTADGSLYFTRNLMSSDEGVFVSRFVDGEFTEPEELDKSYNSDDYEIAILIAPDEAYMLIWQTNSERNSRLTVSYKQTDGSWSDRIEAPYYCGGFLALSPDGKYLFFENEGICWVSSSFIDDLKPEDLK